MRDEHIGNSRDQVPVPLRLAVGPVGGPLREFGNPWGSAKMDPVVFKGRIFEVEGVSEHGLAICRSLLDVKVMISGNTSP